MITLSSARSWGGSPPTVNSDERLPVATQIQYGGYSAIIADKGAALSSLALNGRDLIVPHVAETTPVGYSGQVLIPWRNRIAGATYVWEGETLNLPVNEPATGAALHGLCYDVDWQVDSVADDSVTLTTEVEPTEAYPFALESKVTYRLSEDGLEMTIETTNVGTEAAPYGASTHPYLTAGGRADDWTLRLPAGTVLEVDENLIPTAEIGVAQTQFDFRDEVVLEGVQVDHAFGSLPEGMWTVTVRNRQTGHGTSMVGFDRWVQIYTGEHLGRTGVAVEPMTCPPNAFNSGVDLVILDPGETHTFRTGLKDASK